MGRPTPLHLPRKLLLTLTLLLATFAALLLRPAASSANGATSACSSSAHAKHHVRACAGRHRTDRSHGKAKRKRSGRRHPIHKKKKAAPHGSRLAPAATAKPATCEDGSQPQSEGDGSFSCADGSEPVCASGAEPTPSKSAATLLCPTRPAAGVEWSEAECEDGGAPERHAGGAYACADGSRPGCPDGSQPALSDDGSMLVCLTQGAPAPASPPPTSPAEEAGEGDSEDSASSRVASAS